MKKIVLTALILMIAQTGNTAIYKWVDENGKAYFSDTKPENQESTDVDLKLDNIIKNEQVINNERADQKSGPDNYQKDSFKMPSKKSKVPYRFVMTSAMNVNEPVDRLSSINITMHQKSFSSYIKLTGIESGIDYKLKVRVIDAKGELIFDKDKVLKTDTNSLWFVARVSPNLSLDEPGNWTIQAILNDKFLFVERRRIEF